jgi:hypothetical protein
MLFAGIGEDGIPRRRPREIRAGRKLRAGRPSFLRTSRRYKGEDPKAGSKAPAGGQRYIRQKAKSKEPARRRRYEKRKAELQIRLCAPFLRQGRWDDNQVRQQEKPAAGGTNGGGPQVIPTGTSVGRDPSYVSGEAATSLRRLRRNCRSLSALPSFVRASGMTTQCGSRKTGGRHSESAATLSGGLG